MPLSMIEVLTRMSHSCRMKRSITRSSWSSGICPWPTSMRASGTSAWMRSAAASSPRMRLCT